MFIDAAPEVVKTHLQRNTELAIASERITK